ncbi:MAG: 16S rRNA (uracil(1498)-N(3))-methyltransferase [Bacteroidales bacterium]|nr:16S rRNA (uracil(1498)-N(3))-methyltransferase [Bacteroidales bacterium]MCF8405905.1 16S rRNA (uracil(1498)-N(3))-methyltransferase [Bacteroidales bacterium]
MNLFYTPDINNEKCTLSEEESRHCIKVLRLNTGDLIHVTDGIGSLYQAQVTNPNPKKCELKVVSRVRQDKQRNHYLHMAVALTKNINRFEWFLEKASEIGIEEISPMICEHSERRTVKTARCSKVIISAVKQSLKTFVPKLNEPVSFEQLISKPFEGEKYIAYCSDQFRDLLVDVYQKPNNALILIGPEGDFSEKEIHLAIAHSFHPVSLGKSRLRTETAALSACLTFNLLNDKTTSD